MFVYQRVQRLGFWPTICLPSMLPCKNKEHVNSSGKEELPKEHSGFVVAVLLKMASRKQTKHVSGMKRPFLRHTTSVATLVATLRAHKTRPTTTIRVVTLVYSNLISILAGGWPNPLKNMSSSVGMMKFPTNGKIKHVPNHQPYIYILWFLWAESIVP